MLLVFLLVGVLVPTISCMVSPWSPASWRLTLNVGREPGTYMPEEWGSSGARLVLPIDLIVESDASKERDALIPGAFCIRPCDDSKKPSFINEQGEQLVDVREGGWKMELSGKKGYAAKLQFWLDVATKGATRNDVTLPAERIYFGANCWRTDELQIGQRMMAPIIARAEQSQRLLEEQLSHETGDRRLDGTDPLETMAAYKDMAGLVLDRDEDLNRLKEAERSLPNRDVNDLPLGSWPGSTEPIVVSPNYMAVKRKKLFGHELHVIGTWKAIPLTTLQPSEIER